MRKIKAIVILAAICVSSVGSQQVRELVFIVEPNIMNETKEEFLGLSNDWKRINSDFSDWLREMAEGGSGSGFLYVDDKGDNYIITNRHVVSFAESADITQKKGSETVVFEKCPIVYVSDDVDIAILAFPPNSNVFEKGLPLSPNRVSDGDEVFSAGYPGVDNTDATIWQFAKGNVTNSDVYEEGLFEGEFKHLIQHSANIDHGNSGGPLLINTENGYQVVGVNTYSFADLGREDTHYAIPSDSLFEVIRKSNESRFRQSGDETKVALDSACDVLENQLNSDEPDVAVLNRFLSIDLVSDKGIQELERILEFRSPYEAEKWWDYFISSPWDAMRGAAGEYQFESLKRSTPITFVETLTDDLSDFLSDDDIKVRTVFQSSKKMFVFSWILEYGRWRILEIEALTSSQAKNLALAMTVPVEQVETELLEQQKLEQDRLGQQRGEEVRIEQEQIREQKREQEQKRKERLERWRSNRLGSFPNYIYVTGGIVPDDLCMGFGYTRFIRSVPMYITNEFIINLTDQNHYYYHVSTGYVYSFEKPVRLYVGGGAHLTAGDPFDTNEVAYYAGIGPSLETGVLWFSNGMLSLGFQIKSDGIFYLTNDDDWKLLLNYYALLHLGLTW